MNNSNETITVKVNKIHLRILEKAAKKGDIPAVDILINDCLIDLYKQSQDPPIAKYDTKGRPKLFEIICESYLQDPSNNNLISYTLPMHVKFEKIKFITPDIAGMSVEDYIRYAVDVCAIQLMNPSISIRIEAESPSEFLKQKVIPLKEFFSNKKS